MYRIGKAELLKQEKSGIVFRFCRPSGALKKAPSRAMAEALRRLCEADEMQAFVANARAKRRTVVIEVFHSSEHGHPLLIHTAAVPKERI